MDDHLSAGVRQRPKTEPSKLHIDSSIPAEDERGGGVLPGADEGGLRQGLFSCIFSIGTISIIIWLLLFFLLRPGGGCTRVDNLGDLVKALAVTGDETADWRVFAQELGISADQVQLISEDYGTEKPPRLYQVAKFWYDRGQEVCWERVVSALEVVGESGRASVLSKGYLSD